MFLLDTPYQVCEAVTKNNTPISFQWFTGSWYHWKLTSRDRLALAITTGVTAILMDELYPETKRRPFPLGEG